jgi:hypothetical protein
LRTLLINHSKGELSETTFDSNEYESDFYEATSEEGTSSMKSDELDEALSSFPSAIDYLIKKEKLSDPFGKVLKMLFNNKDIHVVSTWQTFLYIKDLEDFMDSLLVLESIKKG